MHLPEYISVAEVQRICRELGISDWSSKENDTIAPDEAQIILKEVNKENMPIPLETFIEGLRVELEHGTRFADTNVTNNHPLLTGMIVIAHLKETMDYYQRIDVAELEGDLKKALLSGNIEEIESKYKKLNAAQNLLNQAVADQLK